jgi:hypothetical protein
MDDEGSQMNPSSRRKAMLKLNNFMVLYALQSATQITTVGE